MFYREGDVCVNVYLEVASEFYGEHLCFQKNSSSLINLNCSQDWFLRLTFYSNLHRPFIIYIVCTYRLLHFVQVWKRQ